MQVYDFVRSLRLPAAMLVYLAGASVVVGFALSWLTRCFGSLFDAMEVLFSKRSDGPELPRELAPTARALADLRRARDDAEQAALAAEQRKNELVAYLAHDIRTPLTSIVGYLTLLAEAPGMPETQRARYAQVALDRSYRLEAMMEEFFEITRYNLSSIPIERQHFDAALPVSYTHLDVYKRQDVVRFVGGLVGRRGGQDLVVGAFDEPVEVLAGVVVPIAQKLRVGAEGHVFHQLVDDIFLLSLIHI